MANKTIRFEVFKRDSFQCQYCGRTPPEVILEIDHLMPKSKNGKDSIDNYVTACFDCNRGKGKRLLKDVPKTVKENYEILKEKRFQLKQYHDYLEKIEHEIDNNIQKINTTFSSYFPDYSLSEQFMTVTIKNNFSNKIPINKLIYAMKLSCIKHKYKDDDNDSDAAIQYFCGICWNWIKNPETRDW